MESCADTSGQSDRNQPIITIEELRLINNVYQEIRVQSADISIREAVHLCSSLTNVSVRSVYRALKTGGSVERPKLETPGKKRLLVNDKIKHAIRMKYQDLYLKNEIPTLSKIHAALAEHNNLPKCSRKLLLHIMNEMNFCYLKRSKKHALMEKNEIVLWRREYLEKVKEHRTSKTKIYYLGETAANSSKNDVTPFGKEPRLIATHIGSESGFMDKGLHVFQRSGDCHTDMDSEVFEKWFASVLTHVEPKSVVVMESTPCRSRRVEKLPLPSWRKEDIMEWLNAKHIEYNDTMLKVQLLEIVERERSKYEKYRLDEMAKTRGVTVLRLPPYHPELNPIELIWTNVKGYVAKNNKTFKLADVKVLLERGIDNITVELWKKCIRCVQMEEERLWDLDTRIESLIEPLIKPLDDNSDSDSDCITGDLLTLHYYSI